MSGEKESAIVATAMRGMQIPEAPPQIKDPNQPDPPVDPLSMIYDVTGTFIWHGELKMIASRRVSLAQGLIQAFAIIWDQCSKTMKGKLDQLPAFQQINTDKDMVQPLQEIRNIICGRESHHPLIYTMVQLIKMLCSTKTMRNNSSLDGNG